MKLMKHPRYFRRRVVDALGVVERLAKALEINDNATVLLEKYREDMANRWKRGLLGRVDNPALPSVLELSVKELDEAFKELHNYWPEDHVSAGVESVINSRRARGPRKRKPTYKPEDIEAILDAIAKEKGEEWIGTYSEESIVGWFERRWQKSHPEQNIPSGSTILRAIKKKLST